MIKWEMPKKDLLQHLEIVQKGLPVRTPLPILENILFIIDDGFLYLKTTNLDMGFSTRVPVSAEGSFQALFPAKIVELIRHAQGEKITFEIKEEEQKVNILSEKSLVELFLFDADDFPTFPEKEGKKIEISQASLRDLLKKTTFSVSREEGKQIFQGVLFEFNNNQLKVTASDTFRLAQTKETVSFPGEKISFLCPGKNLEELNKILKDKEETLAIYVQERKVIFDLGEQFFFSLLMDNKYPDLESAIPSDPKTSVVIKKELLEQGLGRTLLLAESVNNLVKVSIGEKFTVKSQSEVGKIEVDLDMEQNQGEPVKEIYYNGRFLLDPLKVLDEDKVELSFFGSLGPCTVKIPGKENFFYLALPVKTDRE